MSKAIGKFSIVCSVLLLSLSTMVLSATVQAEEAGVESFDVCLADRKWVDGTPCAAVSASKATEMRGAEGVPEMGSRKTPRSDSDVVGTPQEVRQKAVEPGDPGTEPQDPPVPGL